jgi:hypothetical protein
MPPRTPPVCSIRPLLWFDDRLKEIETRMRSCLRECRSRSAFSYLADSGQKPICCIQAIRITTECTRVAQVPDRVSDPLSRPVFGRLKGKKPTGQHKCVVLIVHVFWSLQRFENRPRRSEFRPRLKNAERPRASSRRPRPSDAQDLLLINLALMRSTLTFPHDLV